MTPTQCYRPTACSWALACIATLVTTAAALLVATGVWDGPFVSRGLVIPDPLVEALIVVMTCVAWWYVAAKPSAGCFGPDSVTVSRVLLTSTYPLSELEFFEAKENRTWAPDSYLAAERLPPDQRADFSKALRSAK